MNSRRLSRRAIVGRSGGGLWRRATHVAVDALDLVDDSVPAELARGARGSAARSVPQESRSVTSRRELRAEDLRVAGLEQQPVLAVAQHLLVDRDARGDRHRAGRDRLHAASCVRGASPADAAQKHVRAREQRLERARAAGRTAARARAARRPSRAGRSDARGRPDRRAPGAVERQPAQRAQEEAQRGTLLLERRTRSRPVPLVRSPGAKRSRSTPGRHDRRSRPGRSSRSARASRRRSRARASRRPKNSSMNRRATCVESTRSVGEWKLPTFSAREWRSAAADALGANGSCTCTMSSGAASEQPLDRAARVERQRHACRRGAPA